MFDVDIEETEDDLYPEPASFTVWSDYVRTLNEQKLRWRLSANCVTDKTAPDMYPPRGDKQRVVADSVCVGCPHVVDCLFFALVNRESEGVWGGTTEAERTSIFKSIADDGFGSYRVQFTKEHEDYLYGLAQAIALRKLEILETDGIFLKAQA